MFTKKEVKFGGISVLVFGMFLAHGTRPIVCLNTRVNAAMYKNLLEDHMLPNINNSGINSPIFMQDKAPCHKAKSVLNFPSWPKQRYSVLKTLTNITI